MRRDFSFGSIWDFRQVLTSFQMVRRLIMNHVNRFQKILTTKKHHFVNYLKKNPLTSLALCLIFLIALFFRTYNYFDRIYFYADNTHYVELAYYAHHNLKISQIGPFAQAPFFTGPGGFGF